MHELMQLPTPQLKRPRDASRDRVHETDVQYESDDADAHVLRHRTESTARARRGRDLSPRRSLLQVRATQELQAALPSLSGPGIGIDSFVRSLFVRTVIKSKPSWNIRELDALVRVTTLNHGLSATWHFEFGNLIVDWWATRLSRTAHVQQHNRTQRHSRIRTVAHNATSGPVAAKLPRDIVDAILSANCGDSAYKLAIRTATYLFQALCCLHASLPCARICSCKATHRPFIWRSHFATLERD